MVLFLAWLLDILLGDPASLPHPVVYMGRWISFWEHRLNRGSARRLKGMVMAVCSILLTYTITYSFFKALPFLFALVSACSFIPLHVCELSQTIVSSAFSILLIFYCLAGCTLRREVRLVFEALDRSLADGRRQVARIVGRDTQQLNEREVGTAALETLAENLCDGVIAPLFWYAVLGLPGMLSYKMINTLDSMIGYHTPRYQEFGCCAARLDDFANFLPARITAFLILVSGWFVNVFTTSIMPDMQSCSLLHLCRFTLFYGPKHASPNSGWPEAALAALLDCQFGGPHDYFGEVFYKPFIGSNPRNLTTSDLRCSIYVTFVAEFIFVVLIVSFTVLFQVVR